MGRGLGSRSAGNRSGATSESAPPFAGAVRAAIPSLNPAPQPRASIAPRGFTPGQKRALNTGLSSPGEANGCPRQPSARIAETVRFPGDATEFRPVR